MKRLSGRFSSYEAQATILKVTSYDRQNLCGYLSNPFFGGDVFFDGLIPMLKLLENLFDTLNFPQRSMEQRTFDTQIPPKPAAASREACSKHQILATFKLRVLFRQNASWSGVLVWREQEAAASFRSVLELIGILDSALSEVINTAEETDEPVL